MDALKEQMHGLMQQRAALEAQIAEHSGRLNAPGQPGMNDPLVDREGYPRSDIDVAAVRADRNAVIRLTNDHKSLSQQLERLLHQLHALARDTPAANGGGGGGGVNGSSAPAPAAAAPAVPAAAPAPAASAPATAAAAASNGSGGAGAVAGLRPFAIVDEVADGSPAQAAGIQLGDQLCRFGAAVAGSPEPLQAVARELAAHEGQEVAAHVLRAGQPMALKLVPQSWSGRGLLGCHLRSL